MNTEHIKKSSAQIALSGRHFQRVGVLGAGAWGTALAASAVQAGRDVVVWAREPEVAAALSAGEGNPTYLPNVTLPPIRAESDMAGLTDCEAILAVVPAQFLDRALQSLATAITPDTPVALCAKGLVKDGLRWPTELLATHLPDAPPAVLSGPSFAIDVAQGLPTAVTLAAPDRSLGEAWARSIGRAHFRMYLSDDMIGAEVGGAVKNVLAIACGACEGLGLGKSAHAALIARGFAEMQRLALALGAKPETLGGLSGLGDLVLTCSSPQSRNMSFGASLGAGSTAAEVLASRKAVTEGAATAPALVQLAERHGVDMPICNLVAEMVADRLNARDALTQLLDRPFREETD